jgi:L-alanine-DL-glutamate epimerase-like enolase superfamily enzyme
VLEITAVRTIPIRAPLDGRAGNPLMRELLEEPPAIDAQSRVHLPSGPGLGVKLNRAAVEKWRLDR